jgi:hypothetical protein
MPGTGFECMTPAIERFKTIRILELTAAGTCYWYTIIRKYSRNRGRCVGIVTWLWAGRPGFDFRQEQRILSPPPHPDCGYHPASYPMDIGSCFIEGKAAGA